MSLVERLAEKFAAAKHQNKWGATKYNPIIQFEVRWWLNAIADELEQHENTVKGVMHTLGLEIKNEGAVTWLRSQAKEEK